MSENELTKLQVFLHGRKAGTLCRPDIHRPMKIFFSYDVAYDGPPLSLSMPVCQRQYDEDVTYAFFQNLLPEDALLKAVCKQRRIASDDLLTCLGALGKETAGAIVITDESVIPAECGKFKDITADIAACLDGTEYIAVAAKTRLSLAGAQDKLAVVFDNDRIFAPVDYSPTTHILKPDSILFPGLALNEAFCLDLARAVGISSVKHMVRFFGEKPVLILERYDRIKKNGKISRLHQEDMCQAMGIYGSGKYQRSGLYEGAYAIVAAADAACVDIRRQLMDFIFFNLIIGNNDGHAKNLSLLYDQQGNASVAPLYDLVCTEIFPGLDEELAIAIGRHFNRKELTSEDLKLFAEDIGLPEDIVQNRLTVLCTEIPAACAKLTALYTKRFENNPLFSKISDIVSAHAKEAMNFVHNMNQNNSLSTSFL